MCKIFSKFLLKIITKFLNNTIFHSKMALIYNKLAF